MTSHLDMNSAAPPGQLSGPLYAYIPGFAASLGSRGYASGSIALFREVWERMKKPNS